MISLHASLLFFAFLDMPLCTLRGVDTDFQRNEMDIIYLTTLLVLAGLVALFARGCAHLAGGEP